MRGILMIEPLYHQAVAGLKTQTRRSGGLEKVNGRKAIVKKGVVVKPAIVTDPDYWMIDKYGNLLDDNKHRSVVLKSKIGKGMVTCKPRYHVGEVLYIKEPYTTVRLTGPGKDGYYNLYKYTHPVEHRDLHNWKNKLFMPVEAARAYVRITGIRCERLLDISDEDCVAEGIKYDINTGWLNYDKKHDPKNFAFGSPKRSFLSLYKFANKVKEVPNLWVWCYSFEYLPNYKPQP